MAKCIATTTHGNRCGNYAMKDSKLCQRHLEMEGLYQAAVEMLPKPTPEVAATNGAFVRAFKCPHCGTLTEI